MKKDYSDIDSTNWHYECRRICFSNFASMPANKTNLNVVEVVELAIDIFNEEKSSLKVSLQIISKIDRT
jgi:hypothetical protein